MRTKLRTAIGDTGYYGDLCGVAAVVVLSVTVTFGESGFLASRGTSAAPDATVANAAAAPFPHAGLTIFSGSVRRPALVAATPAAPFPHAGPLDPASPHAGFAAAGSDAERTLARRAAEAAPHAGFMALRSSGEPAPHGRPASGTGTPEPVRVAVRKPASPHAGFMALRSSGEPAPHGRPASGTGTPEPVRVAVRTPASPHAGFRVVAGTPPPPDVLVLAATTSAPPHPGGNAAARWAPPAEIAAAEAGTRPRPQPQRGEPRWVPDDPMAKRRQPRIWTVSTRYDDLIESIARHHEVEPALVKAIVQAESAFNPNAVSRAGARGLMQVLPETASRYAVDNLSDPRENLKAGVMYLKHLIGLFDGNITMAVAAYNAGPNKVLRYRGVPPYNETQDYLGKVMGLRTAYADQSQRS